MSSIYRGMIEGGSWLVRRLKENGEVGHCRMCGHIVTVRSVPGTLSVRYRCKHKDSCEIAKEAKPGEAGTDAE